MQQVQHDEHDSAAEATLLHDAARRRSDADWHAEEYPQDYDSDDRDVPHRADGEVASPDEQRVSGGDTNATTPNDAQASLHAHEDVQDDIITQTNGARAAAENAAPGVCADNAATAVIDAQAHAGNGAAPRAPHTRSSQPTKQKQQAHAPRVNLLNVHKVNAIPDGVNTPRSRALCAKYMINPKELARRTLQDFEKPGIPADLASMRFRSYQNRLHAHMAVLLPEYTQLIQEEAAMERANAENERVMEEQRVAQEEQQRRASMQAIQERQQQQQQRRRSSAYAAWDASSPLRAKGESPQRRGSMHDGRVATVQERRRLLTEIQHMELVRKMLEKDKEVYQRLRDLADEREIFSELHHLQSGEPKYRQFKELKSLAHAAAQYSRGRYRSPKRALEPAVLEEAMEHLSAQRARSNSRGRE